MLWNIVFWAWPEAGLAGGEAWDYKRIFAIRTILQNQGIVNPWEENVENPDLETQKKWNLGISARRAPWIGEKEESASHHLFTFARLRAEMSENDAGEARRPPGIP